MSSSPRPSPSTPAPRSVHPLIGILGVFLGAMTATLNGRLLSVGLPDLRGAWNLGFDEAAWLPTALNMAMMFIGPFSVFLGTLFGPRRVLLTCCGIFGLVSVLIPFAPSYPFLLGALAVAGLSSGALYPLTLTFVARSLPPRWVIFGVAAYALDVVATSNLASLYEGLLMDHLSWRWIFWTGAILAPLTMMCVFFGVPKSTTPPPRLNWRGFVYLSVGLSLIYGGLDQGERLDWLQSGVVVGMLTGGALLVLIAVLRRWRLPNPMINLPFLNRRNILILAFGVFFLRFSLLSPILVIPGFLGNVQQYRPLQTGQALAWISLSEFGFVWVAAMIMTRVKARLVAAVGFTLIALSALLNAGVDTTWNGQSFLAADLLAAAGIAAAFVGVVGSCLLQAMEMGALANLVNAATFSAALHSMRLMGGQIGAVTLSHYLRTQEQLHSSTTGLHVDAGDWLTADRLRLLTGALSSASGGMDEAQARGLYLLSLQVRAQAFTLASRDAFLLIASALAVFLIALACMRRPLLEFSTLSQTKSSPSGR